MAISRFDFSKGEYLVYPDHKEVAEELGLSYYKLNLLIKDNQPFFRNGCMYVGNVSIVPSKRGGYRVNAFKR